MLPGDTYSRVVTLRDAAGSIVAPVGGAAGFAVTVSQNGDVATIPGGVSVVARVDGRYKASFTIPLTWQEGDVVQMHVFCMYGGLPVGLDLDLGLIERTIEIGMVRKLLYNRLEVIDFGGGNTKMVLYEDDGTTVCRWWEQTTDGGEPVQTMLGMQTKRGVPQDPPII